MTFVKNIKFNIAALALVVAISGLSTIAYATSVSIDAPGDILLQPAATPPPPQTTKPTLTELVTTHAQSKRLDADTECLASAVYFEARGESLAGQLAVAEVVLNRTKNPQFPTSPCEVILQAGQFSFVENGGIPPAPRDTPAWKNAVAIAHIAENGVSKSSAAEALYFHADYARPYWRNKFEPTATLGSHIFYK